MHQVARSLWLAAAIAMAGACDSPTTVVAAPEESAIFNVQPGSLSPSAETALITALRSSYEVKRLLQIRAELEDRASARLVTREMLRGPYNRKDYEQIGLLLGMSREEMADLSAEMSGLKVSLFAQFPVLTQMSSGAIAAMRCPDGMASGPFRLASRSSDRFNVAAAVEVEAAGCKWLPFIIALGLCVETGPAYILCAYLAYCSFCDDEVTAVICW